MLHLVIRLLIFEFDEAAERLEASVESYPLDQHVEFSRNHIQCHTFICDQNVVRNVLINQVIEYNTSSMRQCFLSILECSLLLLILADIRRQQQAPHGPVIADLAKSHRTIIHIDLFLVLVLERRPEE